MSEKPRRYREEVLYNFLFLRVLPPARPADSAPLRLSERGRCEAGEADLKSFNRVASGDSASVVRIKSY